MRSIVFPTRRATLDVSFTHYIARLTALAALAGMSWPVGGEAFNPGLESTPDLLTRHIDVGGVSRSYLLHVPATLPPTPAVPLVLVFHGGGSHAAAIQRFTRFDTLADRHGFIVAYPEGVRSHWNDTRGLSPADDVEFVWTLIAQLKRSHHVDQKRIYATDISNGGFFSVRLACDLTGEIAAVAAVAATMPETLMPACKPGTAISIMFMHGTQDPLVRIDGGVIARRNSRSVSLREAVDFWRRVNHASDLPSRTELPDRQVDGTHVRRELYRSTSDEVEVVVYTVEGGGHTCRVAFSICLCRWSGEPARTLTRQRQSGPSSAGTIADWAVTMPAAQ